MTTLNRCGDLIKAKESEEPPMDLAKEKTYTIDDIYALPEGQRAELIDGKMYTMAPPRTIHQRISGALYTAIYQHIKSRKGAYEVFAAPFAVFLNKDDKNYVEPDISVICNKDKIDEQGCNGAPDWVIEIVSPSTSRMDYGIKLFKYRTAGVREYWIINPSTHTVNVYDFENDAATTQYTFDDEIPVCIYRDLCIRISDFV